jgi:hypothetical protein
MQLISKYLQRPFASNKEIVIYQKEPSPRTIISSYSVVDK